MVYWFNLQISKSNEQISLFDHELILEVDFNLKNITQAYFELHAEDNHVKGWDMWFFDIFKDLKQK